MAKILTKPTKATVSGITIKTYRTRYLSASRENAIIVIAPKIYIGIVIN